MKICILTSGHDIFDNRIYFKEIMSLKKKYDEIYLIAPGEKDFVTEEGITVKCFAKRKAWYDRVRPMREMFNIALNIKADVYHAHEPDSFSVAVKLKKILKCKIIYDSHEYHPEGFAEHFKYCKKIITKLIYYYEKKNAMQADYIISVNNLLIEKFKKYNRNVGLLPNYPVISYANTNKSYNKKPTFIYVGGIREDRGIFKILESIKLVDESYKYIFVGPILSTSLKERIEDYIEDNLSDKDITFTGKVPHLDVFKYMESADAGFVILQPDNWRYVNSEPIKLFEYMMSKTAIIASDFPMMKNIVTDSGCGLVVKPDDTEDISKAIKCVAENRELFKKKAKNGWERVTELYNWGNLERELFEIYKSLEID